MPSQKAPDSKPPSPSKPARATRAPSVPTTVAKRSTDSPAGRSKPKAGEPKVGRGRPKVEEPKDHVLQARVPESLYDDLVDQARRLRVPVSNLVRNILQDSVRMVENIVDGGLDIAQALTRRGSGFDPDSVAGWQPMIAARRLFCAVCGKSIEKGEQAFLSVGAPDGRAHALCGGCQCEL